MDPSTGGRGRGVAPHIWLAYVQVLLKLTGAFKLLLAFIAPPFKLWHGRDGSGRPDSGSGGLTASRRGCRSGLRTVLRRCVHGATFAHAAEEALKPR
jgi:hypothetical protein